jgi:hypothetical protein
MAGPARRRGEDPDPDRRRARAGSRGMRPRA